MVTNAHLVWPFDKVRVVFTDGSVFPDAPALSWDLLGNLAVIGPLQTTIDPVALVDGEDLTVGSEVFLVGYPRLVESPPAPVLSRGLISGRRDWGAIGMTYFQTNAPIEGDQRGGALVSEKGEVVGIYGFSYPEAGVWSRGIVSRCIAQGRRAYRRRGCGRPRRPPHTARRRYHRV